MYATVSSYLCTHTSVPIWLKRPSVPLARSPSATDNDVLLHRWRLAIPSARRSRAPRGRSSSECVLASGTDQCRPKNTGTPTMGGVAKESDFVALTGRRARKSWYAYHPRPRILTPGLPLGEAPPPRSACGGPMPAQAPSRRESRADATRIPFPKDLGKVLTVRGRSILVLAPRRETLVMEGTVENPNGCPRSSTEAGG